MIGHLVDTNTPGYPIDGNRWSENQSIKRYQSIKLVNWYRLLSVNRWSFDNHTKTVHRLLPIGTATSNRRHARCFSDHPPFLGGLSLGTKLAKLIRPSLLNAKNIPRCTCTRITTCPSLSFRVIMPTQEVREEVLLNIRCIVKGYHFAVLR